ncbi:Decarboxylase family protein [Salmonella enterica subsp. enterica]|nr:Decarboxylase family protein [Salmonella enterica subsp. enterica]
MKGAAVGHAQQRYKDSRFIGMTEPSIIAAEPPNPLVNELIIMPDIENAWKRSSVSHTYHHLPGRRGYGGRAALFAGDSDESSQ